MSYTDRTTPSGKTGMGIRTLLDLRERCVIEEETGCWRYPTSVDAKNGLPRVAIPPGVLTGDVGKWTITTARKAGWLLSGRKVGPHEYVYANRGCQSRDCCSPYHSAAGTRQEMAAKLGHHTRSGPLRSVINRRNYAKQAATKEQVSEVLRLVGAKVMAKDAAVLVGLHPATVSKILSGKHMHQRPIAGASIFAMGASA
jgi:hypothetical protein